MGVDGLDWRECVGREVSGIGPVGSPDRRNLDSQGNRAGLVVDASEAL